MTVPGDGQTPPTDPHSQDSQHSGEQPPQAPQFGSPDSAPQAPQFGSPDSAPQPAAAPAATGLTAADLSKKLGAAGLINPLPSLAVGGATYAGGIVMAIVTIVLVAVAAMLTGIGNPVEASLESMDLGPEEALSGVAMALRFPFQLVALAMLGGLGFSATIEGASASLSVRLLPAMITLVMVLLSFYGGRFVQRRQGGGQLGIWVSAVVAGFAVALVTVLAALIFAQPLPLGDGITLRLHAAGFDSFFGAFFLIAIAHGLGRVSLRSRPAWWPLLTDLAAGFKLATVHALLVTVVAFLAIAVVTTIQALVNGEMPPVIYVILLLPLLGGYVLSYLTGLDMLSALSATSRGAGMLDFLAGGLSGSEYISVFSMPWYAWLGALVLIPVGLCIASLLWQHQRQVVPGNVIALAVSWAALPIAYFIGALALMILGVVSMQVAVSGGFLQNERFGASLGLAAWTPLLAGVAGVLVELLSRFVAPLVAPYLPGRALSWFRRPLAPAAAGATVPGTGATSATAEGAPAAAESVPAPVPMHGAASGDVQQPPAPVPLSPAARKLLIGGGIAVGAALVLVTGLTITFNVVSSTLYSPEKQVEQYLSALQEGDASTAVEISAPNAPSAEQALLTDAIAGAAGERISGFEITGSESDGDEGYLVTARVTQDSVTTTRVFHVERAGRAALVFPDWQMGQTEYAFLSMEIPSGTTSILVNGQEVAVDSLAVEDGFAVAAVLPGQYTVGLPASSEFVDAEESTVFVSADPDEWYELHAAPVYTLNDSGLTEVQSQVNAVIDECATSQDRLPGDGCPFETWFTGPVVEGSGSWTVDSYPTVKLEKDYRGEGWTLSDGEQGKATFSYQREGWSEDDEPTDETVATYIQLIGTVTLAEDGTLTVELSDGW